MLYENNDNLAISDLTSLFKNDFEMFFQLTKENSNVFDDENDKTDIIVSDIAKLGSRMNTVENKNILYGEELKVNNSNIIDLSTRLNKVESSLGAVNNVIFSNDNSESILSWEDSSTISDPSVI